jgi:hypothetical protein
MIQYEHTQRATSILILAGTGMTLALGLLALEGNVLGMAFVLILPVIVFGLFGSLTVRIDEHALLILFGFGLIRRRVALQDIVACEQVRTRWYEGWGIHLTSRGWLYNISGFDALLVTRTNGSRFLVGTDDPQRLLSALLNAIAGKRRA